MQKMLDQAIDAQKKFKETDAKLAIVNAFKETHDSKHLLFPSPFPQRGPPNERLRLCSFPQLQVH